MDAIELLERCHSAEYELRTLRARAKRLREVAYYPGGSRTDNPGGGKSTAEPDRMAAHMAALDEVERAVRQREKRQRMEEVACAVLIDGELAAHGQAAEVLFGYYVQRMPVKLISVTMSLSISRVKNLKTEGIELMRRVPDVDVEALLPPEYYAKEDEYEG